MFSCHTKEMCGRLVIVERIHDMVGPMMPQVPPHCAIVRLETALKSNFSVATPNPSTEITSAKVAKVAFKVR